MPPLLGSTFSPLLEPRSDDRGCYLPPLNAEDLSGFAGKYVNGPQAWEIFAKEGRLYFKAGDAECALTKTGETRLSFGDALENDLMLVRGPDGKAEYLFDGLYSARRQIKP